MSLRGLLVGALVLCALAGAVYWSRRQEVAESAKGPESALKLVTIPENAVQRIEVQRKGEAPSILERDKSNHWQITSPQPLRADSDAASSLVSSFANLTEERVADEKPSDFAQFGLAAPSVQVTATAKDGKRRVLLIGDETPTGGGFFAKLDNASKVFTIPSATRASLDKTAGDLRDRRLLTFDDTKVSRIDLDAKGQSVEFGKAGEGEWQILKPRPLRPDNLQVEEAVRKLKDARMESVSPEEAAKAAARFASAARVVTAKVTDPAGTQTLEVRKSGEDYLARGSAVEGVHKVNKDLAEALSKGLDGFRNKKLFDFGWSDPEKVELQDGAKRYSFVKGGEKWWANGKEMDAVSVQSLIDKLRELSAIKFNESGFTTPFMEIAVTSNGGKRVERVLISKSGDRFFAKRDGEAAIYELDGKPVEEIGRAAADVKAPPPPPKK